MICEWISLTTIYAINISHDKRTHKEKCERTLFLLFCNTRYCYYYNYDSDYKKYYNVSSFVILFFVLSEINSLNMYLTKKIILKTNDYQPTGLTLII